MTLTREAITSSLSDRLNLSRASSAKAIAAVFDIIKKNLEGGVDVSNIRFGKFCVNERGNRRGGNPGTGEDLMLSERRVVSFKWGTVLKRNLNGGRERTAGRTELRSSKRKPDRLSPSGGAPANKSIIEQTRSSGNLLPSRSSNKGV